MSTKDDIALAVETINNTRALKKKYPGFALDQLPDVLEISEKYGIPVDEMYLHYGYTLKKRYANFEFSVCHGCNLTNKETGYKQDKNEWYIHLSFGGCGRLNFANCNRYYQNSNILYSDEPNKVWHDFLSKLLEYNPLDYDGANNEYLYAIEDGYRLYNDFRGIYMATADAMNATLKEYRIKEMESAIEMLKKGE